MGVEAAVFDQDGWQDLFVANVDQEMYSHHDHKIEVHSSHFSSIGSYCSCFTKNGRCFAKPDLWQARRLRKVTPPLAWPSAIFDNDGATDVLVAVNNGAPLLLKNNAATGNQRRPAL